MIDKRIGKRIKQCRERLGLSQEAFAEKTGLTPNYISTVERGMSFPRCEKLIVLLNGLEVSADAIFCDVVEHSTDYQASTLSKELVPVSGGAEAYFTDGRADDPSGKRESAVIRYRFEPACR